MVKIVDLNDNRKINDEFENEHGISLYIECYGKRILFDAGQTDIFMKNAQKLNIDLSQLDAIVLSHGDFDHGNGLKYLKTKTKLLCHPDFMLTRISKRTGNNNGLNQTREELKEKFNLIESKAPYYIGDEIIFLGEIERKNNYENDNLPAFDENGNTYKHIDDSGLVIKTENGIIVFSGCAHSGICNTVEYAKKITKEGRILAVMGGFHLKEVNEQTIRTIQYMQENNVQNIYLAHCTSDEVCEEFKKHLKDKAKIMKVGEDYLL